MKVKMKEVVQGTGISGIVLYEDIAVTILEIDGEYEVSESLGKWIIENGKGTLIGKVPEPEPVHYGSTTEPELKNDGELYDVMTSPKKKRAK